MSNHFKYTYYKHKSKIWIGISVLTAILIAWLVYFLIANDTFEKEPEMFEQENSLAEHIVSASKNGKIDLIDVETKEVADSLQLEKGSYIFQMDDNQEVLYSYNGDVVQSYAVTEGSIDEQGSIVSESIKGVSSFHVQDKNIAFLSNDEKTLTFVYESEGDVSKKTFEEDNKIDDYKVQDDRLLYATSDELHFVTPEKEEVLHIGDKTNSIHTWNNDWLIQNLFGSGVNQNILAFVEKEQGLITEVDKTDHEETYLLNFDEESNKLYTTHFVNASEPYHVLTTWYVENGELTKEQDVTVQIPIKEDAILYNGETTIAHGEYLYTHFTDRIEIFDIRSQSEYDNIAVSEYFAAPVLQ